MRHFHANPRGFFNSSFVFRRTSVLSPRRGRLHPSHVFVRWSLLKALHDTQQPEVTRRSQRELVLQDVCFCVHGFLCVLLLSHSWAEGHSQLTWSTLTVNSFLLWTAGCSLSNTDWTLGKEKTHKWIDIIKRDVRRSFERSVGFLTTSVSYRQKKKKPWNAAFRDICIHFSQLYEALDWEEKKEEEEEWTACFGLQLLRYFCTYII